ncbi:hypothetical protein CIRMBP1231_00176 [Enterococcus cecorum]|uniref:hypothetical protein n=1 Tax=Enterococcus cecorum TaxID=44008 RepID=UPI0022CF26D5|nr:hypothetical protein [Enterococcus cecorum]CAI3256677.1 hypothetical protein CIRMBP1258_00071 [Enterococcus cecorum]CAI3266156.1 hypothetical protein CIRMBP1259_00176 [Enterococcus cecorum]CAI3266916.1 hypothetical protein CIRMBP1231_00176 [Enterococcus cecorum]CAI3279275.1 hypothetical protein CIRMBP1246_00428 [Enterococcus cecorum]CAI3284997.1 hypothetical protein CIRMBP1269_00379 [Enterococcus cecorum]
MAEIISFPNQSANTRVTAELMDDILHTSLELGIYQSMRTGHFDRVIVDFYLLPLSEQEALKKRDPQTVCYYAEQIAKKMNLYK